MRHRFLRTSLQYAVVLAAAIVLNFLLPRLAPGDAIDYLLPPEQGSLPPAQRAQLLSQFGLDKPQTTQFTNYITQLAQGDMSYSIRVGRPVRSLLWERVGWTALLVGGSVLLSSLIGAALGFRSAWHRGRRADTGTLSAVMLIDSTPPFFIGMVLLLVFSVKLGWFPTFGAVALGDSTGLASFGQVIRRLVLPLTTLTLASIGPMYLIARSSMVSELGEDYVLMAEAKGLTARQVRRHARRNALLPVSTVALIGLGTLVGGATVVETVFSYPGLGRLIFESVLARDYPVLQGAFLLLAIGVILANYLNDLLYPFLDPRVRQHDRATR